MIWIIRCAWQGSRDEWILSSTLLQTSTFLPKVSFLKKLTQPCSLSVKSVRSTQGKAQQVVYPFITVITHNTMKLIMTSISLWASSGYCRDSYICRSSFSRLKLKQCAHMFPLGLPLYLCTVSSFSSPPLLLAKWVRALNWIPFSCISFRGLTN